MPRRSGFNKEVFSVYNAFVAYFVGLVYADGCIQSLPRRLWNGSKRVQHRTVITMLEVEHLLKLKSMIGATGRPYKHKSDGAWELSVYGKWLVDYLRGFGVEYRKSFITINLDRVPQVHFSSFVCGFYDGDGYLTKLGEVGFVGQRRILEQIRERMFAELSLCSELPVCLGHCLRRKEDGGRMSELWDLRFHKKDSLIVDMWLHAEAPLFLQRKYLGECEI